MTLYLVTYTLLFQGHTFHRTERITEQQLQHLRQIQVNGENCPGTLCKRVTGVSYVPLHKKGFDPNPIVNVLKGKTKGK